MVAERGEGWLWMQLDQPFPRCDREALRRMRAVLAPVLPTGHRSVEEYLSMVGDNETYQVWDLCL